MVRNMKCKPPHSVVIFFMTIFHRQDQRGRGHDLLLGPSPGYAATESTMITCLAVFVTKTVGRLAGIESLVTSGASCTSCLTISGIGLSFSGVRISFFTLVTVLGGSGSVRFNENKFFLRLVHTKLKLQPTGFRLTPDWLLIEKKV